MTTNCRECSRDITDGEKADSKFVICKNCNSYTAKGNIKNPAQVSEKHKKMRKNNLKEALITFIGTKEKANLQEIYAGVPSNKDSIRAVLNLSVSKGDSFTRVGKGEYALIK